MSHNLVAERHALAAMFQYPLIWPDVAFFVKEEDFTHAIHKTIFNVLKLSIESKEHPNDVIISSRIKQNGIQSFEDIPIEEYVEQVSKTKVSEKNFSGFFKELAALKVQRKIGNIGRQLVELSKRPDSASIGELVSKSDKIYSEGISSSISIDNDTPQNIFANLQDYVEYLGENPLNEKDLLYGPFDSFNRLFGGLHRPGAVNCFAARTGIGKTSWNLFYNIWMAEKYGYPVLWMDFGEMSPEELQLRAAACMTKGEVPLFAIESGDWRRNPEWKDKIRAELPRAAKLTMHYKDVSYLKQSEIISYIRRYQYNVVGRENQFFCVFDYLKPFDSENFDAPEWKVMGQFIKDIKSFIKAETKCSFNTSLQINRSGITTNKNSKDIDDSENSFSISDRIVQQCSLAFILRRKTNDELAREAGKFGNLKCMWVKTRHLGKDAPRALEPIELPDGRVISNYINIRGKNFFFEDLGDVHDMLKQQSDIFEEPKENDEKNPLS